MICSASEKVRNVWGVAAMLRVALATCGVALFAVSCGGDGDDDGPDTAGLDDDDDTTGVDDDDDDDATVVDDDDDATGDDDDDTSGLDSVTENVGPSGGSIRVGPAAIVFPPDALSEETAVTLSKGCEGAPAIPEEYTARTDLFSLTPFGTVLAKPMTVTVSVAVPLDLGFKILTVANPDEETWEEIVPRVSASEVSFEWGEFGCFVGVTFAGMTDDDDDTGDDDDDDACGNGEIDEGEACDEGEENGVACDVTAGEVSCTYCSDACESEVVRGAGRIFGQVVAWNELRLGVLAGAMLRLEVEGELLEAVADEFGRFEFDEVVATDDAVLTVEIEREEIELYFGAPRVMRPYLAWQGRVRVGHQEEVRLFPALNDGCGYEVELFADRGIVSGSAYNCTQALPYGPNLAYVAEALRTPDGEPLELDVEAATLIEVDVIPVTWLEDFGSVEVERPLKPATLGGSVQVLDVYATLPEGLSSNEHPLREVVAAASVAWRLPVTGGDDDDDEGDAQVLTLDEEMPATLTMFAHRGVSEETDTLLVWKYDYEAAVWKETGGLLFVRGEENGASGVRVAVTEAGLYAVTAEAKESATTATVATSCVKGLLSYGDDVLANHRVLFAGDGFGFVATTYTAMDGSFCAPLPGMADYRVLVDGFDPATLSLAMTTVLASTDAMGGTCGGTGCVDVGTIELVAPEPGCFLVELAMYDEYSDPERGPVGVDGAVKFDIGLPYNPGHYAAGIRNYARRGTFTPNANGVVQVLAPRGQWMGFERLPNEGTFECSVIDVYTDNTPYWSTEPGGELSCVDPQTLEPLEFYCSGGSALVDGGQ